MVKIYESPDGGKTVYERDTDSRERICIEDQNILIGIYTGTTLN